jgi:hypothetical protein
MDSASRTSSTYTAKKEEIEMGEWYPGKFIERITKGKGVLKQEMGAEVKEVKRSLIDASNDEVADADKYWVLARRLRLLGFTRQAEKVESIAKDEERHNIIISDVLKEIE